MDEKEKKVLGKKFIRHDPIAVRFLSPIEYSQPGRVLQSRFIETRGMFVEVVPPLGPVHPFDLSAPADCMIRFRQGQPFVKFTGKVTRVMEEVQYENSKTFSLVGVKFERLSYEAREFLKAHELAISSQFPDQRSERLPVFFSVEPFGMDVMSTWTAVDLSMTGMFVSGNSRFPVGKELRLRFRLPFQKEEVLVNGRVIWTGGKMHPSRQEEVSGFGLQFLEMENSARMALASYYAKVTV